ncbi:MAG: hypothetical protein WCZ43_03550 [Proteiniphilum sp.]
MRKEDLLGKITGSYLSKETDYAILISGEWGIGKTYLLKEKIIPRLKEIKVFDKGEKWRPIYISLSGLKSLDILKELMFSRINVSVEYPKTRMDRELEVLKNTADKNSLLPLISIPRNVIFCFDDLERINPLFLEEALGFINQYIEHYKCKVIFLGDENRLKQDMGKRYSIINEKYIRYTFALDPCLTEILEDKSTGFAQDEKDLLIRRFEQGECGNIRTFLYAIESINSILEELSTPYPVSLEYQELIKKQIINYVAIFSIEYKKGIPFEILLDINFPQRILSFQELGFEVDFSDDSSEVLKGTKQDEEKEKKSSFLQKIQSRYFDNESDSFEPFFSIAEYIRYGNLRKDELLEEVGNIIRSLEKRKGTLEEQFLEKIKNIFNFTDTGYLKEIEDVLAEIDKGEFSLETYLQSYSQLLVLESYNIEGVDINDEIYVRFVKAIEKSFTDGKLLFDSNLDFKYGNLWSSDAEGIQRDKYRKLFDFAQMINYKANSKKENLSIVPLLQLMNDGMNYKQLSVMLVDKRWELTLMEEDAQAIFDTLLKQNAKEINSFRIILGDRYVLREMQTPASYEYPFIRKMIQLIDEFEKDTPKRTISFISILLLRNSLKELVRFYSLYKKES